VAEEEVFDPRGVLAALDRNRVGYVVIGGLARVLQGTDEITNGVDVCPALRPAENLERLSRALEELEAQRTDRRRLLVDEEALAAEPTIRLRTALGEVQLVAFPAGTRRGFEDLRRGASREPIGEGLRPQVASIEDLARMSAALAYELGREPGREAERLRALEIEHSREVRRIMDAESELQHTLGREREIERGMGIDI
jgi:hypothetical protein